MNREARRIRIAAALILVGLCVEGFTLHWSHPTAFFVFAGLGGVFLLAGVLIFLSTLLGGNTPHSGGTDLPAASPSFDDKKSPA